MLRQETGWAVSTSRGGGAAPHPEPVGRAEQAPGLLGFGHNLREPLSPEIRNSCCFPPLCSFANEAVAASLLCVCPFSLSGSPVMLFATGCGTALFVVWWFTVKKNNVIPPKGAFLLFLYFKMCKFCPALSVLLPLKILLMPDFRRGTVSCRLSHLT